MRIDIITVLPELLKSPFEASILKRAIEKQLVSVHFHNLRDYTELSYNQIDDYQYGGGAGMVMMVEPIDKCISKLQSERTYDHVIYMTPDAASPGSTASICSSGDSVRGMADEEHGSRLAIGMC